jgi:hypothetical protein
MQSAAPHLVEPQNRELWEAQPGYPQLIETHIEAKGRRRTAKDRGKAYKSSGGSSANEALLSDMVSGGGVYIRYGYRDENKVGKGSSNV